MLETEVAKRELHPDRFTSLRRCPSIPIRWSRRIHPPTSRPRWCGRVLRRRVPDPRTRSANDAAWRNVWRAFKAGEADGRDSGDSAVARHQDKPAVAPLATPGGSSVLLARCTWCWPSCSGAHRPVFRTRCSGLESTAVESRAVQLHLTHIVGGERVFGPPLLHRRVRLPVIAGLLCLLIAFPVAYYTARLSGRWRGLLLRCLSRPSGSAT